MLLVDHYQSNKSSEHCCAHGHDPPPSHVDILVPVPSVPKARYLISNVLLTKSKDLLADITALYVMFGIPLAPKKKAALVLETGQCDYTSVMTCICTIIQGASS